MAQPTSVFLDPSVPPSPDDATKFLNGTDPLSWAVPSGGGGGLPPTGWSWDASALTGPQIATDTALFGVATENQRTGGIGDPAVLITIPSQGVAMVWMNNAFSTDRAQMTVQLENDGRVYLKAIDEWYITTPGAMTIEGDESVDIFNDFHEITFSQTMALHQIFGSISGQKNYITATVASTGAACTVDYLGTTAQLTGQLKGDLQTNANAVTGLTAGVLAALTNASIVVKDGSGQAYRVPVII